MTLNIAQEVVSLQQLTIVELRHKYIEVFGEACRSRHKQWLIKRIAWRIQANAQGGLSERARKRATELANDADLRLTAPKTVVKKRTTIQTDDRLPQPGNDLTRNYKGESIVVKVLDDGFEYNHLKYKSLSAVAKAITGKHWNGYHFFGINNGRSQ